MTARRQAPKSTGNPGPRRAAGVAGPSTGAPVGPGPASPGGRREAIPTHRATGLGEANRPGRQASGGGREAREVREARRPAGRRSPMVGPVPMVPPVPSMLPPVPSMLPPVPSMVPHPSREETAGGPSPEAPVDRRGQSTKPAPELRSTGPRWPALTRSAPPPGDADNPAALDEPRPSRGAGPGREPCCCCRSSSLLPTIGPGWEQRYRCLRWSEPLDGTRYIRGRSQDRDGWQRGLPFNGEGPVRQYPPFEQEPVDASSLLYAVATDPRA